jgi:hypothetical protein
LPYDFETNLYTNIKPKQFYKMRKLSLLKFQKFSALLKALPIAAFAFVLTFTSCTKDEEVFDAPTITLTSATALNVAGNDVATTIRINSPGGAKSLVILKNGVPFESIALNKEKSVDHNFTYTIEALSVGSVINFTFQAFDQQDQTSGISVFEVIVTSKQIVEVTGSITGTITWTSDKVYRLNGFVRVQDGGRLNIEPGTIVIGDRESKGTLIVQMGGKIYAEGTKENPIVMTSERPVGFREPGDWGGLVVCGKAPNNTGGIAELEGGYGAFHGGDIPNDNSGVIRYVRIEYAGVPINPNEEVNTLTMGSVGSGTVIEYVQASYGLDDAFEWFGGTVNHKYLIAYKGLDDDFDVDLGYSGRVQFGLGVRSPMGADQSGSNGFEVDNNGTGTGATPFTSAVFANISILGPKNNRETPISLQFQHAAQLRRNSRISIYNSVMTGYPDGLYIDDVAAGSGQAFLDDHLQIRNLYLAGVEHWGGNGYGSAGTVFTDAPSNGAAHPNNPRGNALKAHANFPGGLAAMKAKFETAEYNNRYYAKYQDLGIDPSAFLLGEPKFTPNAGSVLLNTAKWDNTPKADDFFEKVNFVGAFGTQDWTTGWAEWNCHVVSYF